MVIPINNKNSSIYNYNKDTLLDIRRTSQQGITEWLKDRLFSEGKISDSKRKYIEDCKKRVLYLRCKDNPQHDMRIKDCNCNWKYCSLCNEDSGKKQEILIRDVVMNFKSRRMFTLAFTNTSYITKDLVKKFLGQFQKVIRKLRQKGYVSNYVRVIEVKKITESYNFHIHVIYDGVFIPVRELSEIFNRYTKGESYIVDIRLIKDRSHSSSYVSAYVSKYLSKMPMLNSKEAYYSVYCAFKNIRMFQSSLKVSQEKKKGACPVCKGEVEVIVFHRENIVLAVEDWVDHYFTWLQYG